MGDLPLRSPFGQLNSRSMTRLQNTQVDSFLRNKQLVCRSDQRYCHNPRRATRATRLLRPAKTTQPQLPCHPLISPHQVTWQSGRLGFMTGTSLSPRHLFDRESSTLGRDSPSLAYLESICLLLFSLFTPPIFAPLV